MSGLILNSSGGGTINITAPNTANNITLSLPTLSGGTIVTTDSSNNAIAGAFIPSGSTVPTNGVYLPTSNTVAIATGGSERIRINTSGLTFPDASTQNTGGYTGFRNRIINGDMRIDQRNAGASVTAEVYNVDRWRSWFNQTYSFQQVTDAPAGFSNSLRVTKTSTTQSVYGYLVQYIEGFSFSDLQFGTASASPVTLSFWVKSSIAGAWSAMLTNGAENRSYAATYTINAANTWEYKTVTIPGDTTGTWVGSTNGKGVGVCFNFAASGAGVMSSGNTWLASGVGPAPGASAGLGTTNGATFYITGVQLEKGTTATPFEQRLYGTELALCQRYYARILDPQMRGVGNGMTAGGASRMALWFPVTMRATPTATLTGTLSFWDGSVSYTGSVVAGYYYGGYNSMDMDINTSGAFTTGRAVCAYATNDFSKYVSLSAEL